MLPRLLACAFAVLSGCSFSHDFDALESGVGGQPVGGAGTGGAPVGGAMTGGSEEGAGGDGGAGGEACIPLTCAEVSPSCRIDDGCGNTLICTCVVPSACNAAGQCECSDVPLVTAYKPATRADNRAIDNRPDWTSVEKVYVLDDDPARVVIPSDRRSDFLESRAFDFTDVPRDATLTRIEVSIRRRKLPSSSTLTVQDSFVGFLKRGIPVSGTDVAKDSIDWKAFYEEAVYQWDVPSGELTLVPDDLDDDLTGIRMTVYNPSSNNVTPEVDAVRMRAYYVPVCTPASE